jgi:hypothetical protein
MRNLSDDQETEQNKVIWLLFLIPATNAWLRNYDFAQTMVLLLWLGHNEYMQQTNKGQKLCKEIGRCGLNKPSKQALQSNVVR